MTLFRPSRSDDHLSNYWNALVRNAPAEELARLARLVEPSEIAAIERARAAHARYEPDPAFASRLERTLMNTAISPIAGTIPQPHVSLPSRNGTRDPGALPHRGASGPRPRNRWALNPALAIGLVILLILGSLGGAWLANTREDEGRRMMAPIVATPESTAATADVPMYRGNPERTGVMPGPGISGQPVELWRAEVEGSIESAPAVVNGVLYFGAGDGFIYALDTVTGREVWRFDGEATTGSSPTVHEGMVYAASGDGTLSAIDAAGGTEAWTLPDAQDFVIADDTLYAVSPDGVVHAHDLATQEERWRAPMSDARSRGPAVADGVVYANSIDGVLHTFDAATGEPGWTFQTEGGGTVATAAISDGVVYQNTFDGETGYAYALDAASGEELWRYEGQGFLPPAVGGGLVYLPGTDSAIYALDAATGEEVWQFQTGSMISAAPALIDDTLYVAPRDGFVYALDAATGAENWRFAIEGEAVFGPTVSGGVAYLGTTFGYFYAIGGTGEATPASEASPGWTQWRGDAARSSVTNFGPVNQPDELWRFQADGACMAAPAVMGYTVYAACRDGNLYAFNRDTGEVRWTFTAEPFGDVAIAGDLVYVAHDVGDVSSRLYAVDRVTGEERWRYDAGPIQGGMAATDDLLVFRSLEGLLIGIDARTGEERWRTEVATDGGSSTPALAGGMAYAGSEEGTFTAVDAATGEIAWQVDTGDLWNGTAVVVDGIAYIGGGLDSPDGFLNAYDAATGELLWQRDEPISSPSVANGVGYSGTFDGTVHAFDTATGEELWRVEVGDENRSVTIGGDILYVSSDVVDRGVYALDAATGAELWHIDADGGIDSQAAVVDGEIYVTTTFGVIQAFGESDAGVAAASPEAMPVATPADSQDSTPVASSDIAVEPLWQTTGGPDPLLVPTGMAVAPDGTVWVVDSGNNRFQLFSPDGEYLETWGTPGDGEGEFNFSPAPDNPNESMGGIAFAPDGSFYVGDTANQRIQKFDADRTFLLAWGTEGDGEGQFLLPYWPAVAPNGNVYVVDGMRSDVQVFSPEGEYLSQLTGPGTEDHQLSSLGSVTIADDGTVHVTDPFAGTIKTFATDGAYIESWGGFGVDEGELRGPTSVAFDAAGNSYVTDLENGRVQVFSLDRGFLGMWSQADAAGTPFVVPLVVAIDDAGGIYVTDLALGTVSKFQVTLPAVAGATPVT